MLQIAVAVFIENEGKYLDVIYCITGQCMEIMVNGPDGI